MYTEYKNFWRIGVQTINLYIAGQIFPYKSIFGKNFEGLNDLYEIVGFIFIETNTLIKFGISPIMS